MKRIALFLFVACWGWLLVSPDTVEFAAGTARIRGVVTNSATGEPVANAIVRVQADLSQEAVTGSDRTFTLKTQRSEGEAVIVTAGAADATGAHAAFYNAGVAAVVGSSDVHLVLTPILAGDSIEYAFVTPDACTVCHEAYVAAYSTSAHAAAARNSWVKDMYDGSGTPQ